MNRLRYLIAALVLVAVFSAPQLIRADEGLTLENLSEGIETLFRGQTDLQQKHTLSDARLSVIETRLAPTPTRTKRPTPNATATVQANNRRKEVRARATATAHAKITATAQADSAPSAIEVEMWNRATQPITEVVSNSMLEVARLFGIPGYVASGDVIYLKALLWQIQLAYEDALAIVSPSSLSHVHEVFLRAMGYCNSGAGYTLSMLESLDAGDLQNAILAFEECGYSMERATQMLEAIQR